MKRVALVTGGAQGIGLAIVQRLAADGFHVHAVDMQGDLLAMSIGALAADEMSVGWTTADVTDETAMIALFNALPRVDVLVASAAIIGERGPISDISAAAFRRVIDVNLTGVFLPMREAIRRMDEGGRIVVLSSRGALGEVNCAHYVASKAALIGLTRAAAMETRRRGVTVNAVAPGFVRTNMTLDLGPDVFAAQVDREPRGRAAEPAEIADAVAFLVSPQAGFITGQTLFVDGGKSLGGFPAVP